MPRQTDKVKPQRSCLACRMTADRDRLLRFVRAPDGEVVVDLDAKLPGRGAYTCLNVTCVRDAVLKRQFNRAFKAECAATTTELLVAMITERMQSRILGYLGLANKAGKVQSGGSMVSDAIKSAHKPGLILLAEDISVAIAEKIKLSASVHSIPCLQVMSKDEFGSILGKAPRSALAVKPGGFVAQLINEIQRYRNFLGEVR